MKDIERIPQCTIIKEYQNIRALDVIKALENDYFSLNICKWGSKVFVSYTGYAMKTENSDLMADFLDDGGCEILLKILKKHGETESEIVINICLVICILAWSLNEMKEYLGVIGICEVLPYILSFHIGDALASEHGLNAIAILGKENISNSFLLAKADSCDVITQLGNFGCNIRHERSLYIATNYCLAVEVLCEASNADRIIDSGICSLILVLIRFHCKDKTFSCYAIKTICGLSSLNMKVKEALGRYGVSELIKEIFLLHSSIDPTIIIDVCESIMHLSLYSLNCERLGMHGLCEIIVHSLRNHLLWIENGSEICTSAMLNLVVNGENPTENQYRFVDAGIIDVLHLVLRSDLLSFRSLDNLIKLFEIFVIEDIHLDAESVYMNTVLQDYPEYCTVYDYLTKINKPTTFRIHTSLNKDTSSQGNETKSRNLTDEVSNEEEVLDEEVYLYQINNRTNKKDNNTFYLSSRNEKSFEYNEKYLIKKDYKSMNSLESLDYSISSNYQQSSHLLQHNNNNNNNNNNNKLSCNNGKSNNIISPIFFISNTTSSSSEEKTIHKFDSNGDERLSRESLMGDIIHEL